MVGSFANLSQWLQFCSRREHPSGHRAGGKTGAGRVQGIVVANHKGSVVGLNGDVEGPSLHLVEELRGYTVQRDHGRLHFGEARAGGSLFGQRRDEGGTLENEARKQAKHGVHHVGQRTVAGETLGLEAQNQDRSTMDTPAPSGSKPGSRNRTPRTRLELPDSHGTRAAACCRESCDRSGGRTRRLTPLTRYRSEQKRREARRTWVPEAKRAAAYCCIGVVVDIAGRGCRHQEEPQEGNTRAQLTSTTKTNSVSKPATPPGVTTPRKRPRHAKPSYEPRCAQEKQEREPQNIASQTLVGTQKCIQVRRLGTRNTTPSRQDRAGKSHQARNHRSRSSESRDRVTRAPKGRAVTKYGKFSHFDK